MRDMDAIKARLEVATDTSTDIRLLIERVERLEAGLESILDHSLCNGINCPFGPTCYAVIARTALAEEESK